MSDHKFIDVDCFGEVTGTHYVGQVEVKMALTFKEQKEECLVSKRLCAGLDQSDGVFFLFRTFSRIDAHIVGAKPAWWNVDNMKDTEPVYELAKKIQELQKEIACERSGGKVGGTDNV